MSKIIETLFQAESADLEKIVDSVLTRPNKKYEEQLNNIANKVESFVAVKPKDGPKGEKGDQGPKGDNGDKGLDGRDGVDGRNGNDGKDGLDGEKGQDGVSVVDVDVTFDNHLVVTLSDGNEIDAGKIDVGEVNLQQLIQQSGDGGGGASLPSQTGNAGKFLTTDGTDASWADVTAGVASVNGQTGVVVLTASDVGAANQAAVNLLLMGL